VFFVGKVAEYLEPTADGEEDDSMTARQPQPDPIVHASVPSLIEGVARQLADRHEILQPQRVQQALEKLVGVFGGEAAHDYKSLDCLLGRFPFTLLEDSLSFLPADEACAIIQNEDAETLAERALAAEYLVSDETPLLSLGQLADQLDRFCDHLESDRRHLVQTGLPQKFFPSCRWLNRLLGRLYDVRRTGSPYPDHEPFPPRPAKAQAYTWGRYVPVPADSADTFPVSPRTVNWVPCAYEDADLLPGITAEDAARIEADRPKLFDLKIELLQLSARLARRGDVTDFWAACLRVLTDRLFADEADFYLGIDRTYLGGDMRYGDTTNADGKMIPGGLTNMLEIVRHVEQEITIGTLARTQQVLAGLISPGGADDYRHQRPSPGEAYFQMVARHGREPLDAGLDQFRSLALKEKAFADEYRRRVNDALENEFCDEIVIRQNVKRKLVHKFEPQVRTFVEWVHAHIQAGGQVPQLVLTAPASESNVFQFAGGSWNIRYGGQLIALCDTAGLYYLHFLLERPNREFSAGELRAAYTRRAKPGGGRHGSRAIDRDLDADLSLGVTDLGDELDPEAVAEIQRALQEIDKDLENAARTGDDMETDRLNREKQELADYLSQSHRPGGGVRKFKDKSKRERDAVRNAIDRALEVIRAKAPPLYSHLNNAVKRKGRPLFSYEPEHPTSWNQ
jgi:hypothetical protein